MARINIEEDIESKGAFWRLLPHAGGSRDAALGMLVRFFRLAQKKYGHREGINEEELAVEGLLCMIETGWAIPYDGGGYQVESPEKHFGWYAQRVEAGKARSRAARDTLGRFAPETPAEPSEPTVPIQRTPAVNQPLTLSPSLSLTLSKNKELKAPADAGAQSDASQFIRTYIKAWQSRYGEKTRPSLTGKVQGQIKQFLKDTQLDRACDLIQVYFQIDDPWFRTKCHDFTTFVENLSKVGLALDSGQVPGQPKRKTIEEILGAEAGRGHG